MQMLELKIPPLALCGVFIIVIVVLGYEFPSANVAFAGHRYIAITAVALGGMIMLVSVLQFRRAKTTVNPLAPSQATTIVDSGIYSISRNPMYLGMAIVILGVAAWFSSIIGYLLVPIFCLYMTMFQIKPEERALLATFGEAFSTYLQGVRRWI